MSLAIGAYVKSINQISENNIADRKCNFKFLSQKVTFPQIVISRINKIRNTATDNIYGKQSPGGFALMNQLDIGDVHLIQWKDFFYFTGGIAVIVLGGIGTILVLLGILQVKFLKPFRNRYPYKEFKNFEEFKSENPSRSDFDPMRSWGLADELGKGKRKGKSEFPEILMKKSQYKPALRSKKRSRVEKLTHK